MPSEGYFTPKTLKFLTALALNNNREWFELHKADYEQLVRAPALELIVDFAPMLRRISPHLVAANKKVGGSLMRVQRDTRFSPDKTPYKTNIGIQFRHEIGKDVHAPAYYLHLAPDECFLGAGVWHPDADALTKIRQHILDKPKHWRKVSADPAFRKLFALSGESLTRPPRGVDPDHPALEDLKRKDHVAIADLSAREAYSPLLLKTLFQRFDAAKSYMRFLCQSLDLPF